MLLFVHLSKTSGQPEMIMKEDLIQHVQIPFGIYCYICEEWIDMLVI